MWREYEVGTNEIVDESKENNDSEGEGVKHYYVNIIVHADISNTYFM